MSKSQPKAGLSTDRVVFVSLDPSETRTGWAIGLCPARVSMDRIVCAPSDREILAFGSIRPGVAGFAPPAAVLAAQIPLGPWIPVIECPPPERHGAKRASTAAYAWWRQWARDVAHARAETAGARYVDVAHAMLLPRPSEWRSPLGLPLQAPKRIEAPSERAEWIKAKSLDYAHGEVQRFGASSTSGSDGVILDHDAAEAICILTWAMRSVGSIGTWLRARKPSRRLFAII